MDKKLGNYLFAIGVVVALVLGLIPASVLGQAYGWLASLLVVLGLIVGLLNVTGKETKEFLVVAAVLIIAAGVGTGAGAILGNVNTMVGKWLAGVFAQALAFIVPATVVVALKDIWSLAQK